MAKISFDFVQLFSIHPNDFETYYYKCPKRKFLLEHVSQASRDSNKIFAIKLPSWERWLNMNVNVT